MTFMDNIEHKVPWGFLGFFAAVVFGLFGIYTVFFYSKAPDLRAEILSSAPVLSIREDVQDLGILFKGQNIRESHQLLTLISLKLVNRGNVAVRPADFDQRDLPAIFLSDGDLVRADVIEVSEPYLNKVFSEATSTSNSISFTPFILDPGNFLSIRLLVLHRDSTKPTIEMKGKIANLARIPVIPMTQSAESPTRVSSAFSGDIAVQFIRIFCYGLGAIAVLIGVVIVSSIASKRAKERRRRLFIESRAEEFLRKLNPAARHALQPIVRAIIQRRLNRYTLEHWLNGIQEQQQLLDFAAAHRSIENLLTSLQVDLPDFDRDYYRSQPEAISQLSELVRSITLPTDL